MISPFFAEFNLNEWHTSYYMPTNNILAMLKKKNIKEMVQEAVKISKQIATQKISAISFDSRLYPFIKQYLEPIINQAIVYHIWYAPPLYSLTLKKELQSSKLYQDIRIKTLLTTYKSQFDL
jgi:hypothetical protein